MCEHEITVAHLVTPYLFRTCSWIHTQLTHALGVRAIVLTQALEHPERFPFEPVLHLPAVLGWARRLRNRALYLAGRFDPALYAPALEAHRASVLHAHMGWEGVRALPVARALGLPLVTSFYGRDAGLMPRYPWWRLRYRRLFAEGDVFVVEGPHLGRTLEGLGCPPSKIRVIHLGIDLGQIPFAPRSPGDGNQVEILVSASLRPKKGVTAAAKAFAALAPRFPAARLRILGDGPERSKVEEIIRSHGLEKRVTLEGYVSYRDHLDALARAHLFLAPSRTTPHGDTEGGAPVVLIEAQASGMPVVATSHADIPELVEDGISGLLSPEFDDEILTRNLQWLLEHPEQWEAMGRSGRQRMEREFNAALQAKTLAALYRGLL